MTRSLFSLFTLFAFIFPYQPISAQAKYLKVERNHSMIGFNVPIAKGITQITGTFDDFEIFIEMQEDDFTKSSFSASIKTASINTGIDGRDEHLRSADFFDVEKFPEIKFESKEVKKTSEHNYLVKGIVTMHGVSKEMELPLKYNGDLGKNTLGFSSGFILNRKDFNIASDFKHDSIPSFLAEEIEVEIHFWTKRWKKEEMKSKSK